MNRALIGGNTVAKAAANGCVRDAVELRSIDLGIFALGSCPRRPGKQGEGNVDVSVSFAGVKINPGHYVYADEDGIAMTKDCVHR